MLKLPEHSNIRTILFCENIPNASGAYRGSYWIISFDANGKQIDTPSGVGVGNAEFNWNEKEKAYEYLKWLKECCPDALVKYKTSNNDKSADGLLSLRRN